MIATSRPESPGLIDPESGDVLYTVQASELRSFDLNGSGGMNGIALDEPCRHSQRRQLPQSLIAQRVTSEPGGYNPVVAKQRRDVREIRRRPAQLLPVRQHVPAKLAQPDDTVALV